MATTTITGTIQDPTGTALSGVTVVARILPRPAFVTATGVELAPLYSTTTNGSGVYSLTLTRTADITPSGSFYEITEYIPDRYGGPVKHVIQVGAVSATVYASLVSSPPATDQDVFLTQAAADARYQALGSYGAAGELSTIEPDDAASAGVLTSAARSDHQHAIVAAVAVDSRPGDAASEGNATSFARSNHVHDRETQQGTAATISALSGTDLIQGYPYIVTDANNITGTGIYTPHTASQPARADSLWVKNAQRFQPGFWNQPWGVVGYVQVTADQTTITAVTDLTSLTLTWTAAANRRYRITLKGDITSTAADGVYLLTITDGSNTQVQRSTSPIASTSSYTATTTVVVTPSAGSVTYKGRLAKSGGTGSLTFSASSTAPGYLLIEDIGPNGAAA